MLRVIETISNDYEDIAEVWECSDCGRTFSTQGVGADPDCVCSYEEHDDEE